MDRNTVLESSGVKYVNLMDDVRRMFNPVTAGEILLDYLQRVSEDVDLPNGSVKHPQRKWNGFRNTEYTCSCTIDELLAHCEHDEDTFLGCRLVDNAKSIDDPHFYDESEDPKKHPEILDNAGPTVYDVIRSELKRMGYNGLRRYNARCSCTLDNLFPCADYHGRMSCIATVDAIPYEDLILPCGEFDECIRCMDDYYREKDKTGGVPAYCPHMSKIKSQEEIFKKWEESDKQI